MVVFIKLEEVFASLISPGIETLMKYQIQAILVNVFNFEGVANGFYNCFLFFQITNSFFIEQLKQQFNSSQPIYTEGHYIPVLF